VLKSAINPPRTYTNSVGRGTRKKRNEIGKKSAFIAFELDNINVTPIRKMGREKR